MRRSNLPSTQLAGSAGTLRRITTYSAQQGNQSCPNCGDRSVIIYDGKSGDRLCSRCGIVLESRVVSDEQEWRSFANNDGGGGAEKSRVGGPNDVWLDDGVQGTTIIGADRKHDRLIMTHEMTTALSSSDRQIRTAFNTLRSIADSFGLKENIVERCKEIVKDLQSAGNLRGRTGVLYMLSVVYIACREEKLVRPIRDLVTYDRGITERELARAINRVKKLLPNRAQPLSFAAAELLPRFCARLELSQEVAVIGDEVCRRADRVLDRSHRPAAVASGTIFLVAQLCGVSITLSDIAAVAKTPEGTAKNVYKEMLPFAGYLLPETFRPTLPGGIEALKRTA